MLTTLANSLAYDLQRTSGIVLTSDLFFPSNYLFMDEILLTVLFQSLT